MDSLKWKYLVTVLKNNTWKWNKKTPPNPHTPHCRKTFIKIGLKIFCNILTRSVHTSNLNSPFLKWHQGARRGCPLSSFLFAIVMEHLAWFFSNQELLQGMKIGNSINFGSLYADGILICSCNPGHNLPIILQTVDWFYITTAFFAATVIKPVSLKWMCSCRTYLTEVWPAETG